MKRYILSMLLLGSVCGVHAQDHAISSRAANTVILDEAGVRNLRIEVVEAEETSFEEVIFALGRIEPIPRNVGVVSSRIPGRIVELNVSPDDRVESGQVVARVESRQPGNPPAVIALEAPLRGVVTQLDERLGDPIEPDRALLQITELSQMYAVARVPEHQVGALKIGSRAYIRVAAFPEQELEGVLQRFGTTANADSGTLDALFEISNPEGKLREGMRAEFSIVASSRPGVLSVPRSALQGDAFNRFVYVEDFELKNAFVKVPVQVGAMNDRSVEILGGLLPGDKVVSQGAYSLAFAGGGAMSLKEALDAAHGHEHAPDGSELPENASHAGHEHEHEHEHESHGGSLWKTVSAILFGLLLASLFSKRKSQVERGNRGKKDAE
jgi:cobalt-zinc-cadmium efflux system membrane fusion protein